MINATLGMLEFIAFLAALAAGCVWLSKLPVMTWLNEKLFGEVSEDEQ